MIAKLALRNVRKNAKDYAIYFITIALGVALFYAFNTISYQAVLFDALSESDQRMFELLNSLMGFFSGAVACVLGFLVVYANRFLIRRRKHEFGMYLLLGMGSGRVSRILVLECLIVGIASLVAGIIAGILLSQALSFATAALLVTTMTKYQFLVSGKAIGLTVVCFLVIFVVSAAVDVIYIRRCKLSNLLSSRAASESVKPLRLGISVAMFVVSVVVIALAYWQLRENGMEMIDTHFVLATALMVVGTFMFFASVAGFAIAILQKSKSIYFKGLNAFTVRQVSSKVNTAFVSMAVVCIMLFLALTVESLGMGLVGLFVGNTDETTKFDMTVVAQPWLLEESSDPAYVGLDDMDRYDGDMAACLSDRVSTWNDVVRAHSQLDVYLLDDVTYGDLVGQVDNAEALFGGAEIYGRVVDTPLAIYSVDQMNSVRSMMGEELVELDEGEFIVNNNIAGYDDVVDSLISEKASIEIAGYGLECGGSVSAGLRNSASLDAALEVVVPDVVIEVLRSQGAIPDSSFLNIMYMRNRVDGDARFAQGIIDGFPVTEGRHANEMGYAYNAWPAWTCYSGKEMLDQASGLRMCITYLAIYIGFVLLMATAAILAIQQLSETTDSLERYRRLSTLGASHGQILESLAKQTATYFIAPLLLAACHAACAIIVVNGTLFKVLGVSIASSVAIAAITTVVIYGVYLAIAYATSRRMVKAVLK